VEEDSTVVNEVIDSGEDDDQLEDSALLKVCSLYKTTGNLYPSDIYTWYHPNAALHLHL